MNQLPPLGRDILPVVPGTYKLYSDLLQANSADAINATPRTTHAYGSHPQQQLDVYTPANAVSHQSRAPILVFAHGGGFVSGDKVLEEFPGGLVYKNLGYFFSQKLGYETVLLNYRLLGERDNAKYPDGAADIGEVMKWLQNREDGSQARPVFVMGNSAGGIHLANWLLDDKFKVARQQLVAGSKGIKLSGAIFLSTAVDLPGADGFLPIVKQYFGDDFEEKSPYNLAKKAIAAGGLKGKLPRILFLVCELDPEWLIEGDHRFEQLFKEAGIPMELREIRGHNHISPPLALGTGSATEEQWGLEVGEWCSKYE